MTLQKSSRVLAAVATVLAAAPAFTADKPAIAPAVGAPKVEQAIHDYIMTHPEVILESVRAYDARKQEAARAEMNQKVKANLSALHSNSPSVGAAADAAGAVTIVEFFDYRCGYCKKVAPTVADVLKTPGVRVVYKDLPILGPESMLAAQAALAAEKQGAYLGFHEKLLVTPEITAAAIDRIAAELKLDGARLKKDMASPEIAAQLAQNQLLAEKLGISATPTFVIGKELKPGALDAEAFQAAIEAARGSSQTAHVHSPGDKH